MQSPYTRLMNTMRRIGCLAIGLGLCAGMLGCTGTSPQRAPYAVLQATPMQGTAPLAITLNGEHSTDDGIIRSYRWEVDGEGETVSTDPRTTHIFDRSGVFRVRLTVIDDSGLSDTTEVEIVVENTAPIASSRFSNDAPVRHESVLFDASSSYDVDGDLVDFSWNFGDGTTRRGTRVSHSYSSIGHYIVVLTVTDNAGAQGTVVHTMTVHEGSSGGGCGR